MTATLLVLVLLAAGAVTTPSQSYTTGTVDADMAADVVVDEDAVLSLDLAADVKTGATERLVTTTNYVGQSVTVTVTLTDGSGSYGDLVVDGTNVGDSTSFSLADTASQRVDFTAPCDESLVGKSVTFDVDVSGDGISGSAVRSVDIASGCSEGVVYAVPSSRDLRTIRNGSDPTAYDVTGVQVTTPQSADLDGDGSVEVGFVNSSTGDVHAVDRANATTLLLNASDAAVAAEPSKSRMAVGTWGGSEPSVLFVDDGESSIYRVDDDEYVHIVDASNGASAVVGVVDVDGDGAEEIVFVDGSAQLRYVQEDGSTIQKISNGGVGSNNGVGAGRPADFDGDGTVRVPFVDGSNQLSLVTHDGNKTVVTNGGNAVTMDKAPLAAFDWDGDGRPEIVGLDGGVLHVVDGIGGDVTVTKVTRDGSGVDAAGETGAA
ncbi:MAG: hypothetical protein ABEH47_02090 [Haloferacaceae archaeon]